MKNKNTISHVFRHEIGDRVEDLFANVSTFDTYINNLNNLAVEQPTKDLVEHGFQAFVEALIKYKGMIDNYESIPTCDEDLYVHGRGTNLEGNKCTVWSVFKDDPEKPVTSNADGLSSFLANSREKYNVNTENKHTLYVFTNAIGIHPNTYENFIKTSNIEDCMIFRTRGDIETLVDDNDNFWLNFKSMMGVKQPVSRKKKKLRKHQKEAVKKMAENSIGQILLPTGTGKSVIEADAIFKAIEKNQVACCVICTPRIMLAYQLLGEVFDYLSTRKIEAKYVNLNSGTADEDEMKRNMVETGLTPRDTISTTSSTDLREAQEEAFQERIPLIISSTYQSAPRIIDAGIELDVKICDEAHNLTMYGRFSEEIKLQVHNIPAKSAYFMTATKAVSPSSEGVGMNNEDLFGEVIYSKSPRDLIEAGEIVPPFIHQVKMNEYTIIRNKKDKEVEVGSMNDEDIERNVEIASSVVVECFREHRKKVKECSANPDRIGAKLLVVCKGEQFLDGLLNSEVLRDYKKDNPFIDLYAISSASGAYINGQRIIHNGYKEKFMSEMTRISDKRDAIIFHIDMIGEGLDVPGITGVMAFRNMGTIRSNQTLGRSMRLCGIDRKNLYNRKIKPKEWDKMVKPQCWVIVPRYTWMQQDMDAVENMAIEIRRNCGYFPTESFAFSPGDGRKETLTKDSKGLLHASPEEIELLHEIERPTFEEAAQSLIEDFRDPKRWTRVKRRTRRAPYIDIFADEND